MPTENLRCAEILIAGSLVASGKGTSPSTTVSNTEPCRSLCTFCASRKLTQSVAAVSCAVRSSSNCRLVTALNSTNLPACPHLRSWRCGVGVHRKAERLWCHCVLKLLRWWRTIVRESSVGLASTWSTTKHADADTRHVHLCAALHLECLRHVLCRLCLLKIHTRHLRLNRRLLNACNGYLRLSRCLLSVDNRCIRLHRCLPNVDSGHLSLETLKTSALTTGGCSLLLRVRWKVLSIGVDSLLLLYLRLPRWHSQMVNVCDRLPGLWCWKLRLSRSLLYSDGLELVRKWLWHMQGILL